MNKLAYVIALGAGLAVTAHANQAAACGGCFVGESDSTVVTGHRMAISVSPTQTVLWDQIQYAGDPEEFSWVLPVMPGARIELANDAWFDVLDAATATTVGQPQTFCYQDWGGDDYEGSGFGCSGSRATMMADSASGGYVPPPPDVQVVHKGTVGPYETVTLSADKPGALNDWLEQHGYQVPDEIQPTIDAYVSEGFDFIALRLIPGKGVSQMKPVRIVSPGAGFTLPLRMVAAGTGASTALQLFVIGEGRYATSNFSNTQVATTSVEWDFKTSSSNYSALRVEALEKDNGHTWLTSYAIKGSLLNAIDDNIAPMWQLGYQVGNLTPTTIAEAYVRQGVLNGEGSDTNCLSELNKVAYSGSKVVDNCDEEGCAPLGSSEISADALACGKLDDVAVALTGLHPRDVWITRLEAELPRSALLTDLQLSAASSQTTVHHRFVAESYVNGPCDNSANGAGLTLGSKRTGWRIQGGLVLLTLGLFAMAALARRRRLHPR